MNYYNENDPKAAAWLKELINEKLIPQGQIDARSISDVQPNDLEGFSQCHFFAGIGGWAFALELAGWPEDKPVWTGSCPCQPFSQTGKGMGWTDERHLWPDFRNLIGHRKPSIIFGEQVANPDGLKWLNGVRADLEKAAYAVGASDLCAAGVTAPHRRQRLYWVANSHSNRRRAQRNLEREPASGAMQPHNGSAIGGLGESNGSGWNQGQHGSEAAGYGDAIEPAGSVIAMGDSDSERPQGLIERRNGIGKRIAGASGVGCWDKYDILPMRDGKARRVEAGTFPLAHGFPNRVGLLRGYGNAIVPQVAAKLITAFMQTQQ